MRIEFVVHGKPQGKGRHRSVVTSNGKLRTYTPPKTVSYERNIAQQFQKQKLEQRLSWSLTSVYCLNVEAVFAVPKSWTKSKKQKAYNRELHPTVVPDGDNILKAVADGLNGLAWTDDRQVIFQTVQKRYCQETELPHIVVDIATVD